MSNLDGQTKADARLLFPAIVEFAKVVLAKDGKLLPFAYAVNSDGRLEAFGAIGDPEQPCTNNTYLVLRAALVEAATAGRIRAVGTCNSTTLTDERGKNIRAIRILTEHRNGLASETFMPFKIERQTGVCFGKARSTPARTLIFASPFASPDG